MEIVEIWLQILLFYYLWPEVRKSIKKEKLDIASLISFFGGYDSMHTKHKATNLFEQKNHIVYNLDKVVQKCLGSVLNWKSYKVKPILQS